MGDLTGIAGKISIDAAVAGLAYSQHGNITREQLLRLGLSRHGIDHRLRAGRLHPTIWPGVYAVGRPPRTATEHAAAALLACGPQAALSHNSAMALWGLRKDWPRPFQVTLTAGDRRPKHIELHRATNLARKDIRKRDGLWVTSPARTFLDVAPSLSARQLTRTINDARISGHLKAGALADTLVRYPLHRGAGLLRPFAERSDGVTRSDLEDLFVALCERYHLPRPQMNARVGGYEVDALFAEQKVIVELDSYTFHSDRGAFERDRDRDANLLAAGFIVIRITWERLIQAPQREAQRLHTILTARA